MIISFDKFSGFGPGTAHLALVQLPWDVVYTTNYDLLVEQAAASPSIKAAGKVQPVFTTSTDLTRFTEDDILYYKLHGSVDHANVADGRLILTKDDYRHYEKYRKPLFSRLRRDLIGRTFVFVGYSLRDDNFLAILNDVREILDTKSLPLSYAVRTQFRPAEATFWKEKYNIHLINSDATKVLVALKETWIAERRTVVPFEERQSVEYLGIDQSTRLPRVGESFYRLVPSDCTGPSNPSLFFRGSELSWGDARDKIAPPREDY